MGALGQAAEEEGARTRAWQPRARHASPIEGFRQTGGGHESSQGGTPIRATSGPNWIMGTK